MKTKFMPALLVSAALFVCSTCRAALIGDTLTATGGFLFPATATIGDGVEFTFHDDVRFDFAESTLTLTTRIGPGSGGGQGFLVFSDFEDTITGISLASNDGWSGSVLTPQFTAHSVTFDFQSFSWAAQGSEIVFNIETAAAAPDQGTTVTLLGFAFMGLAAARRRMLR